MNDYTVPEWENSGRVHDWRNYISDDLKAIWGSFTEIQKRVISENAQLIADAEYWD